MTDQQTPEPEAEGEPVAIVPAGEAGGGEPGAEPAGEQHDQTREWLAQLQHMIDRVASSAAPVAREVAAKAAELAAVAGEKAGPFARRAAEVTDTVGARVAERGRRLAQDLRHRVDGDGEAPGADAAEPAAAESTSDEGTSSGI